MITSTANLVLNPVAKIDLQLHTILSDGKWTPEALIDHLIREDFALAAITDHDRVDTAAHLQAIALEKHFPLLIAAEMTTHWHDGIDMATYGNPDGTPNKFKTALKDFKREGHIGFQDHGLPLWLRNIKVRGL